MKPNKNHQSRGRARALSTAIFATSLIGASVISASAKDAGLLETSMPLEESGITPHATLLAEVYNNHSGGISNGSAFASLLDVGVELDLEKLAGWEGASIFANAFYFKGDDITGERIGDFNAVTNLYTDTSFNFYNIFFQQSFGNGDSFFKLGQIALDDTLGLSTSWTDVSDDFRLAEGGSSSETVMELTYQLPVNDCLAIQPDVQYIINPQGGGDNALVTGIRAEISF